MCQCIARYTNVYVPKYICCTIISGAHHHHKGWIFHLLSNNFITRLRNLFSFCFQCKEIKKGLSSLSLSKPSAQLRNEVVVFQKKQKPSRKYAEQILFLKFENFPFLMVIYHCHIGDCGMSVLCLWVIEIYTLTLSCHWSLDNRGLDGRLLFVFFWFVSLWLFRWMTWGPIFSLVDLFQSLYCTLYRECSPVFYFISSWIISSLGAKKIWCQLVSHSKSELN